MDNLLRKLEIDPEKLLNKLSNEKGKIDTYLDVNYNVEFNGRRENLRREYVQTMTWYGKSKGEFGAEINDTSGMSTRCLLPDGQVSVNKLVDVIRSDGAQTESAIGSYFSRAKSWDWCDSQVGLLVNMVRYAMIMKLEEIGDVKNGEDYKWDDYSQDGIIVNRSNMMKPIKKGDFFWPGGEFADGYPETCVIAGELYHHSDDSINVAMLKQFEARFVILMLGKWKRQTNYLLDFELDKLVDRIMFRADKNDDIPNLTEWTKEEEGDEFYDEVPKRLTSEEAWNVVFKYVKANRLYRQYWQAMCIINQVTAQFMPDGIEAQAWLDNEIGIKIPKFRACRGRLTFLIKDKPALLGDREYYSWLNTSKYIESNLMAGIIMAQLIETGIGVINMRQNMEYENPKMTLGMNERTRPGSGMVWAVSEAVKMIEPSLANRDSYLFFDTEITSWNKERDIRVKIGEKGAYNRTIKRRGGHSYIAVPILPMPGIPTMLMPIHPFPKQDPLALSGVIRNGEDRRIHESGKLTVTPYQAWESAWFSSMTGRTIRPISAHGFYSAEIYKPEDNFKWVWPLPRNKLYREEKISFVKHTDVKPRRGVRISKLPALTDIYPDFELTYNGKVISKGTIRSKEKSSIFEARDIDHKYKSKNYVIRVQGNIEMREAWAAESRTLDTACEACSGWRSGFKVIKRWSVTVVVENILIGELEYF
ncbi:coat protein [Tea-oil camellia-associated totivirus 1]|uniref:Coat protein n=1 Tax=Tea-oil camellia-associated totivirus 1 TaxID=2829560 RepID=A0AAE7RBE6_9VIRU|nr:coat protein [Tea-oil camellia-associated totivirus 1]